MRYFISFSNFHKIRSVFQYIDTFVSSHIESTQTFKCNTKKEYISFSRYNFNKLFISIYMCSCEEYIIHNKFSLQLGNHILQNKLVPFQKAFTHINYLYYFIF